MTEKIRVTDEKTGQKYDIDPQTGKGTPVSSQTPFPASLIETGVDIALELFGLNEKK